MFLERSDGYCEGCEFISVAEAMARLGFTYRTVMKWIQRGIFRKVKLGDKTVRLYRHDVEKLLQR